jgi:hypothetical protein
LWRLRWFSYARIRIVLNTTNRSACKHTLTEI